MRLSVAFLLLFVCMSYEQGLQRWPYWISSPGAHHYSRMNHRFDYPAVINNDETYYPKSVGPSFFNQERPPLLMAISEDESIPYFPIIDDDQSFIGESRTPFWPKHKNNKPQTSASSYNPPIHYSLNNNNNNQDEDPAAEGRFFWGQNNAANSDTMNNNNNNNNGVFGSLSSILNPFSYDYLSNLPYIANPNRPNSDSNSFTCTGSNGVQGTCQLPGVCNLLGRKSSGSCGFLGSGVCCVNEINKCGQTVTANNTIWQNPSDLSEISSCELTVKLSNVVKEDRRLPICQVRLDFTSFSIGQPNVDTVCNKDFFSIDGSQNNPAPICGDNEGQHMYLNIPSTATTPTDLKLSFTLSSSSTVKQNWKIKIALLPCGASYLAPTNCLQYFTDSSTEIKSFNWKKLPSKESEKNVFTKSDDPGLAPQFSTRQLADQKQNICIRPKTRSINRICYEVCPETYLPFSLSVASYSTDGIYAETNADSPSGSFANVNQFGIRNCNNDYLVIPGGFPKDQETEFKYENPNFGDRYCGERLSSMNIRSVPAIGESSPTDGLLPADIVVENQVICTEFKPFILYYRTNGDEQKTETQDTDAVTAKKGIGRGNQGFCLKYTQYSLK